MISLSILDYSPIDEMSNSRAALTATTELAQLSERLEFKRFWEGTSYIFSHFIDPNGTGIQSTEDYLTNFNSSVFKNNRRRIIVGNPHHTKQQIEQLAAIYQTDEVMLLPQVLGKENRMQSIELLSEVFN